MSQIYNSCLVNLANGSIDLDSNTFYVMLMISEYPYSKLHTTRSDISLYEIHSSGYTAGGKPVTITLGSVDANYSKIPVQFSNPVWTSSAITARGCVIYKSTGNASTDLLLAYRDFGGSIGSDINGVFTLDLSEPLYLSAGTGHSANLFPELNSVSVTPMQSTQTTGCITLVELNEVPTADLSSTASVSNTIRFQETFYNNNLLERGWYDAVGGTGLDDHYSIVLDDDLQLNVLQATWEFGNADDKNIPALRKLFTQSDDITIQYRIKHSPNWDFSVSNEGRAPRRLFSILSTRDDVWDGIAYNYGNLRIDTDDSGLISARWWDSKVINYSDSSFSTLSWPYGNNLIGVTSERSSGLCNTQIGRDITGTGVKGECFLAGSTWWNYQEHTASDFYYAPGVWYDVRVRVRLNSVDELTFDGRFDGVLTIDTKLASSSQWINRYRRADLNFRNGREQGGIRLNQLVISLTREEGGVHHNDTNPLYIRLADIRVYDNNQVGYTPLPVRLDSKRMTPLSSSARIDTNGVVDSITRRGRYWSLRRGWESTSVGALSTPYVSYIHSAANNRNTLTYSRYHSGTRSLEQRIQTPTVDGSDAVSVAVSNNRIALVTANANDAVLNNDGVWFRAWVYLDNWDWTPTNAATNFELVKIRTTKYDAGELILATNHTGTDINVTTSGVVRALLTGYAGSDLELIASNNTGDARYCGAEITYPINQWFCLEAYVRTSSVPDNVLVRVWINDTRVLHRSGLSYSATSLVSESTTSDLGSVGFILCNSWSPSTELAGVNRVVYFDDIIMTNDPAEADFTDSDGFKRIGLLKV